MKILNINNKDYQLKVINTEEGLRNNPQAIELLNRLATESEIDLAKKLHGKGIVLKHLHKPNELWQVNDEWLSNSFSNEANRTVFVVEDEGRPIHATIITINDPSARNKNKVSDEVGTYIYVTHAVTEEEFKGKGVFSAVFNKINTMYLNPKRETAQPIHYSISVSNAEAVRLSDQEELNFIMNLPTYTGMWQKRLTDNQIQIRFQDKVTNEQEGRERLPVKDYLNNGSLDESKIDLLIKEKKPEAEREGKFVRGMFEEGREARTYAQAVSDRKQNFVRTI